MKKLVETLYYCKEYKESGSPIVVVNGKTGNTRQTKKWEIRLFDKEGKAVLLSMAYNNAAKNIARRGATTTLQIWK